MVQVYHEPLAVRHYARLLSGASMLRLIGVVGTIVLSYSLTYLSGGMWLKTDVLYEQPSVHFGYGMIVVLEGAQPGEERLWSSFPSLNSQYGDRLASISVEALEFDDNHDGKADVITVTAVARGMGMPVHSVKVLMDFEYSLEGALVLEMAPVAYMTYASPVPGAALYTVGELALSQRDPLQSYTIRRIYNESLLIPPAVVNASLLPEHVNTMQSILSANMARNETVFYKDMQPVWLAGDSNEFKMQMKFRIPSSEGVVVRRRSVEVFKLGWVQFLAVFAFFWFLLCWAEWVVFHFRIVPTRVLTDLERKKHRF